MHALQVLGSFAVVAAFASCAFDNGSLRWASVAFAACIVGTILEFVFGALPVGLATAALSIVAGRRWWRRLNLSRAAARIRADAAPPRDLHPHA